jgi:hypothetical protein
MKVTQITHTGYRGPLTQGQYLPAGLWTVGDRLDIARHIVPEELARYLIETEQAQITQGQDESPTPSEKTETGGGAGDEGDIDPELIELPDEMPPLFESMSVENLRDYAEELGIDLPSGYMKKADLIALIVGQSDQPNDG